MEHRLIVSSECGYLYNVVNGECSVFYDNGDESEYYNKITKYGDNLLVVGGCKYMTVLLSDDALEYNLYRIDTKEIYYGEAIRFIDDFLVVAFSSHHSIMFVPVEDLYNGLKINHFSPSKQFVAQLLPFHQFRFNSIDFIDNKFIICGNFYGTRWSGSGVILVEKDFSSFSIQNYGWNTSRIAVVDNKIYLLCNSIYGTDKKACLVVNNEVVCTFHDSYKLSDFSITDEYIYIVGRCILETDGTTLNRGIILILDRDYKLVDVYSIKGSGTLLGCINVGTDYANDKINCNCNDLVNSYITNGVTYKEVNLLRDKRI